MYCTYIYDHTYVCRFTQQRSSCYKQLLEKLHMYAHYNLNINKIYVYTYALMYTVVVVITFIHLPVDFYLLHQV